LSLELIICAGDSQRQLAKPFAFTQPHDWHHHFFALHFFEPFELSFFSDQVRLEFF
jgi:hypothetical protein